MSTPSLLTQAGASGRAMARRNEHVRRLPAHSIDRRAFSAPPLPGHLVILTKLSPPFFSPPLCDLCLLPLRLALRPLRQALRYPWLCAPSVDPSGDLRTSRQSVRPVLGGIGLEFPDHGKLRRRPGLQHRIVPNPDPRDGRRCGFHPRQCGSRVFTGDRRLDCDFPFDCGGAAPPCPLVLPARTDVPVRGSRNGRARSSPISSAKGPDRFAQPALTGTAPAHVSYARAKPS